jgi:hypothetical protein
MQQQQQFLRRRLIAVSLHQLPQFYGLYTVELHSERHAHPTHWLVMNNILGSHLKIHQKFDLKGSKHGRSASAHEKAKGSASTLKCNDFRNMRLSQVHSLTELASPQQPRSCVDDEDEFTLTKLGLRTGEENPDEPGPSSVAGLG